MLVCVSSEMPIVEAEENQFIPIRGMITYKRTFFEDLRQKQKKL